MILSDEGIRQALAAGELNISPAPGDDQFTTSALDLTLGDDFHCWNRDVLALPGSRTELNLAEQQFQRTARVHLIPAARVISLL